MPTLFNDSGAHFSTCRKFRFALWRIWDTSKPLIMFIGLNPSTANETDPDPTITRVIGFARSWGYGGVYMMNCFPLVSSKPEALKGFRNTLDNRLSYSTNNLMLSAIYAKCKDVVFAWGAFKIVKESGRDQELHKMFPNALCLKKNKDGSPIHPLYVAAATTPILFSRHA